MTPLMADPQKPCTGCGHSAAHAPFPGHPSGERPCMFCIRNPTGIDPDAIARLHPAPEFAADGNDEYVKNASKAKPGDGLWYDGKPAFKTPMDCYISTDRLTELFRRESA